MSPSDPSPRESFPLIIDLPNEDLAIEISDAFDQIVAAPLAMHDESSSTVFDTSVGRPLKMDLPRGLYRVRSSLGEKTEEQVVCLNREMRIVAPIPARSTSAAYEGVESSHEYYSEPAATHSLRPTTCVLAEGPRTDSWLFLFVRARDRDSYAAGQEGLEQVAAQWSLESPLGVVIPLVSHCVMDSNGWLAFSAPAPAGDYRLHDLGDEPRTTPIVLYPQWQTQLFLTFDGRVLHQTLHVSLSRLGRGFLRDDAWARAVDLGLSVLVSGRGTLPSDARRILLGEKFENPMLGLIAAWVALRDVASRSELSPDVLDNLNYLLPKSPDVAVLCLAHARRYGRSIPLEPIRRTPMLRAAASELIDVATEHPEILPAESILDDVSPRLFSDSAFTSWQPLDSELPASLRSSRSKVHLVPSFDRSLLGVQILESSRIPTGTDSTVRESAHVPEQDPGMWLPEAVADVIEQQARRQCRAATAPPLSLPGLAKRTGVTPNAVRQVLQSVPLQGIQIAMSLSDTPPPALPAGKSDAQINDVTAYLARTLVAAGATIAYGGDFRREGFTKLLAEVIKAYNETGTRAPQSLHCYLAAHLELQEAFEGLPLKLLHLSHTPEVAGDAVMPQEIEAHPRALYFSDMRRVMAKHTDARIVLGGQMTPTTEKGRGYGGRYPGIVEEAWRTLEAKKPLYVAGGFGGAAALVADLLEQKAIPAELQDRTFAASKLFQDTAAVIKNDPNWTKLAPPQHSGNSTGPMEDLAQAVRDLGLPHLENAQTSLEWNGLTVAENYELFRTRDPMKLTSLVLKGLLAVVLK